ncbi:ArsR/SmtB family transcription factor [Actinomycetospora lemnae]|uniref:Metalloregulator ArsR/SmtB family transcription factor n=1 Tax=Actinomycetospora lemnae TaxID=3019891 RepID=A0ABT5SY34_9PSEU|nr:metalloregulator ArsR/SmtB family transcription factor [Actinomycetospora sp. DW7H6]MDD7967766.1 metalloregulator ArsR/SmtB family transcription factor [Actinomycetospora sp. DW7H6]
MSKHEERVPPGLVEQLGCYSPLVREPLSGEQAGELSRLFKAMGDPVRLRLLSLIASHAGGEACVCDLTEVFDLSGPTISHHLKVLREAGLITGERRATWVYYRIQPEVLEALAAVLVPAAPDTVPNGLGDVVPQTRHELPVVEA